MSKTVADYPVKWGFGLTAPAPWSPSHPHLGVDRPTPMRTPLVINGVLVAYTGNTGGVAPHYHLQKVQNGQVVDPKNDGFTIPEPAIVFQVDNVDDTNIGKALRIRDGQGNEWSHFHLDEILVKQGQLIQGGSMSSKVPADETTVKLEYNNGLLRDATPNEAKGLVGQTVEAVQRTIGASPEHADIIGRTQLGSEARRLLGNDVSPQNMEQKMISKYGGSNFKPYSGKQLFVKEG